MPCGWLGESIAVSLNVVRFLFSSAYDNVFEPFHQGCTCQNPCIPTSYVMDWSAKEDFNLTRIFDGLFEKFYYNGLVFAPKQSKDSSMDRKLFIPNGYSYAHKILRRDSMNSGIRSTRFRPVKATEKLAHCYFGFRLSEHQRQMLVAMAKERDISVSGLLRDIISEKIGEYERKKNLTGSSKVIA